MARAEVAVIGGGPAGLMAAEVIATAGRRVTVFDRMRSPGRKFLLAGRGGLNLTHSEPLDALLDRYGRDRRALEPAITAFDPDALRAWSAALGETTFVGSSGRVFPDSLRATPLLRAWLRRLDTLGVTFRMGHTWQGWTEHAGTGSLVFTDAAGRTVTHPAAATGATDAPHATVLALGGASWPRTGSDGRWVDPITAAGIRVTPLRSANCGFDVEWSTEFRTRFAGTPLKNVALCHGDRSVRGEAMVTAAGIEGGAVYALSRQLSEALADGEAITVWVDLRPDLDVSQLTDRLAAGRSKDSRATALRRAAGLTPVAIGLLREATGNHLPHDDTAMAELIKGVPLTLVGVASMERAISTAGGIAFDEIDESYMLARLPGTFIAGEMIDWEAPTGGYLLQANFSTAVAAAHGVIAWLAQPPAAINHDIDHHHDQGDLS